MISVESLKSNIDKAYYEIRKLCRNYKRGLISEDESLKRIHEAIRDHFVVFIRNNGMVNHVRRNNVDEWTRFQNDYQLWKNGEKPESIVGVKWLTYTGKGGTIDGEEASFHDKTHFFELMEAFHIPVEYYQVLEKNKKCSDKYPCHFSNELLVGWLIWQDDGGLLSNDFKIGDEIRLTDHNGLESVIRVTEHLKGENKKKRGSTAEYLGQGYIEGYTTTREREIEIGIWKGQIQYLFTTIDSSDRQEYSSFPMWEEARMHSRKQDKIMDDVVRGWLEKFSVMI